MEEKDSLTLPPTNGKNTSDTVRKLRGMERGLSDITPTNGKNTGDTILKHK